MASFNADDVQQSVSTMPPAITQKLDSAMTSQEWIAIFQTHVFSALKTHGIVPEAKGLTTPYPDNLMDAAALVSQGFGNTQDQRQEYTEKRDDHLAAFNEFGLTGTGKGVGDTTELQASAVYMTAVDNVEKQINGWLTASPGLRIDDDQRSSLVSQVIQAPVDERDGFFQGVKSMQQIVDRVPSDGSSRNKIDRMNLQGHLPIPPRRPEELKGDPAAIIEQPAVDASSVTSGTTPFPPRRPDRLKHHPSVVDGNPLYTPLLEKGLSADDVQEIITGEGSRGNTKARSKNSSAVGLFQFTTIAAEALGTTTAKIAQMTAEEQVSLYVKYLDMWHWKPGVPLGILQAAPKLVRNWGERKSTDVVYPKNTQAWRRNKPWRPADGGDITIGSIMAYYDTLKD